MSIVGYARVSTQEQDLSAQLAALRAAGAGSIFKEKISGVRADRPQLTKMVAALRRGDLVVVTRLDRLGRSVRELLNLLADFEKTGVHFKSLGDPWCDTTTAHGRLVFASAVAQSSLITSAVKLYSGVVLARRWPRLLAPTQSV
jgi:DNA invertase Pin-like site-specific DNA recombinase